MFSNESWSPSQIEPIKFTPSRVSHEASQSNSNSHSPPNSKSIYISGVVPRQRPTEHIMHQ